MCDDDHKSAYHEAGHVFFAFLVGIPISYATIEKPARTEETLFGKIWLKMPKIWTKSSEIGTIYFMSGGKVQKYFCKDDELHDFDEKEITFHCGDNAELRSKSEKYIDDNLSEPKIRAQIDGIAQVLLDKRRHYYSEFKVILER
jgi:ATP-dependent Zn protease